MFGNRIQISWRQCCRLSTGINRSISFLIKAVKMEWKCFFFRYNFSSFVKGEISQLKKSTSVRKMCLIQTSCHNIKPITCCCSWFCLPFQGRWLSVRGCRVREVLWVGNRLPVVNIGQIKNEGVKKWEKSKRDGCLCSCKDKHKLK